MGSWHSTWPCLATAHQPSPTLIDPVRDHNVSFLGFMVSWAVPTLGRWDRNGCEQSRPRPGVHAHPETGLLIPRCEPTLPKHVWRLELISTPSQSTVGKPGPLRTPDTARPLGRKQGQKAEWDRAGVRKLGDPGDSHPSGVCRRQSSKNTYRAGLRLSRLLAGALTPAEKSHDADRGLGRRPCRRTVGMSTGTGSVLCGVPGMGLSSCVG